MNWLCDDALDDHVSELTNSCEEAKVLEALQYDLAKPCTVQWCMLWFSAPTNLNRRFLIKGVILDKHNEAIDSAFQSAFHSAPPQGLAFSRSMRVELCRPLEGDWDVNSELRGWGLGERSDLLPDGSSSEDDLDSDE